MPMFGRVKFADLNFSMISKFANKRRNEGAKDGTIITELMHFSHFLNKATLNGYTIIQKDVIKIKDLDLEPEIRERILTADEQDDILEKATGTMKEILEFALRTGLRISNICHLKWKWVTFTKEEKRGKITFPKEAMKGKTSFTIPLSEEVEKQLKRLHDANGHHANVFMKNGNGRARPMDARWIQRNLKTLCEKAEVEDVHFHDLRRTFACKYIERGGQLKRLQLLLAHKQIETTQRYIRGVEVDLGDDVDMMGKL
jgi:integrase